MQHLATQLERVRGTARMLLVVQRVCQWVAAVAGTALVLGGVDFVLRFPTWLRLGIGLAIAAAAVVWLASRLRAAAAFRPGLEQLALRLERIYPQLAGQLATAVEFSATPERYAEPQTSGAMVRSTLDLAQERFRHVDVRRLIDRTRTGRAAVAAAVAVVVLACVAVALPTHASIAAQRWLAPLGSAEWPLRQHVEAAAGPAVWPVDTPVLLAAQVERGYTPGMRVELRYRVVTEAGDDAPWQRVLMSEQATRGRFERQVDLPESLARTLERSGGGATLEYAFAAGDHATEERTVAIVPRPAVTRVRATITPPAYASPHVPEQTVDLHAGEGPVAGVSALVGSAVELFIGFNQPIAIHDPAELLPGIPGLAPQSAPGSPGEAVAPSTGFSTRFVITGAVETPIRVVDRHGLTNLSEKRYRFEAVEDKPAAVSLTRPVTDEAVLATATLAVEAAAQDDVAVTRVAIEAAVERGGEASAAVRLAEREAGRKDASVVHPLDLAAQYAGDASLRTGDVVVLTGVAEDGFDLEGAQHPATRSTPRRLRIIDEAALVAQLRADLANVRQQAIRLEAAQQALAEAEPDTRGQPREVQERLARAASQQAELSRRVAAQSQVVRNLGERAERNRLDEPALSELMRQAGELVGDAAQAADAAAAKLREAQERAAPRVRTSSSDGAGDAQAAAAEARERQAEADAKLGELVALLDQGGDALSLRVALRQIQAGQENLAEEARKLFPQTVGQALADLPAETRERLGELAQAQAELAEQAQATVQQMRQAVQQLREDPAGGAEADRDQAAAEALAEAAAIAQRQGLQQNMQQSSRAMAENQLAQAGQQQNQAMSTLEQMLEEMGTQQQRMMARLRRRLRELAQAIERLLERQQAEVVALDRVAEDAGLSALEPEQAALRRSTMATEEQANAAQGAEATAGALSQAVTAQGQAVLALRASERMPAKEAEAAAVTALEQALEAVRAMERRAAEEQAREERAKLREQYEALAARQEELAAGVREVVGDPAPAGGLTRQQRAAILPLGESQAGVRDEAATLGDAVAEAGGATVFRHLHDRLDESLRGVADRLRRGDADAGLMRSQGDAAATLRRMAAALADDPTSEPFAGETGSGEGGGGGGGGGSEAVPPAAELRLLRGVQEAIYEATRGVHEGGAADAQARLRELAAEQREAAELGRRMVEQLQEQQGPPTGAPDVQPEAEGEQQP